MSCCPIYERCWFYRNRISLQSQELGMVQDYCHGDYSACARYQCSQSFGLFYVPRGLQPDELKRIKPVLSNLVR